MQHELRHIEPPANKDLEIRVLISLACIGEPTELRIQKAMLLLDEECFYDLDTKEFFNIIKSMFTQNKEFSVTTLVGLLPTNLTSILVLMMQDNYLNVKYLESDIQQLIDFKIYRKQMKILVNTINDSQDELTPANALQAISLSLQKLNDSAHKNNKSLRRTYEAVVDDLLMENEQDSSEFEVDIPFMPLVPNRALITIAGRSGHGKTFFALYLMDKIIDAHSGKQSLYFNLEMHERVMIERHAKLLGTKGESRREIILNGLPDLLAKNVSLVSQPMITIDEIETESRLAAMQQPLAVIVVDYLGLIRNKTKAERKDIEQNDIAKRLAALSIELDCVVLCLIQVNRDFKNRPVGDRCPRPEDSSESMGSVHSSSWWLGIDQPQNDSDDPQFKDLFLVNCRKNRGDAGLFNIRLSFVNGMFDVHKLPFCSTAKKTDFPDGF